MSVCGRMLELLGKYFFFLLLVKIITHRLYYILLIFCASEAKAYESICFIFFSALAVVTQVVCWILTAI